MALVRWLAFWLLTCIRGRKVGLGQWHMEQRKARNGGQRSTLSSFRPKATLHTLNFQGCSGAPSCPGPYSQPCLHVGQHVNICQQMCQLKCLPAYCGISRWVCYHVCQSQTSKGAADSNVAYVSSKTSWHVRKDAKSGLIG